MKVTLYVSDETAKLLARVKKKLGRSLSGWFAEKLAAEERPSGERKRKS